MDRFLPAGTLVRVPPNTAFRADMVRRYGTYWVVTEPHMYFDPSTPSTMLSLKSVATGERRYFSCHNLEIAEDG